MLLLQEMFGSVRKGGGGENLKDKDLTVNVDDAATLAALCSHLCHDK